MLGSLRLVKALLIFTWLLIPLGAGYIKYQRDASQHHMRRQALKTLTRFAGEAQRKYSVEVLSKFKALHPVRSHFDHAEKSDTVPLPATFAIELSEAVSNDDISVRMFSKHPFRGREAMGVAHHEYERKALDQLIAGEPEYIHSDGERFVYARPVTMSSQSCVDCHNSHPDSTYRDWKVGDVRSALVAEMRVPPDYMPHFYPLFFVVLLAVISTPIVLLDKLGQMDAFREQLFTDHLTGVHNRAYLDQQIKQAFVEAHDHPTNDLGSAVMILDLDLFKDTNDQYGHDVGDECLREVAQRISGSLRRDKDLVARYGGEEFLIYVVSCTEQEALETAKDVLQNISGTPMTSQLLQITASLGVCHVPAHANNPRFERACKLADQALYEAKKNGRKQARIALYEDSLLG